MTKSAFSTFAAAVVALLLVASCSSSGSGWVKVQGNKFVGPDGNELVFRGLCFSDPVKLIRDGQWNERYFAEAAAWGANVTLQKPPPGAPTWCVSPFIRPT